MLVIAERINASRSYIASAISSKNKRFIQNEAKAQSLAGVDYINVHAGTSNGKETERLEWLIKTIQEVSDLPLSIDSVNPDVIKGVMRLTQKKPIINAVAMQHQLLDILLPLVAKQRLKVIGRCEDSVNETVQDKVAAAGQLLEKAREAGIPPENLYIDPLVHPLASRLRSAATAIEAIERIMKAYPGVHTACSLTHISRGLPNRHLIHQAFLITAISRGLDAVILDPTDRQLYGAMRAAQLVTGKDDSCVEYVAALRSGHFE